MSNRVSAAFHLRAPGTGAGFFAHRSRIRDRVGGIGLSQGDFADPGYSAEANLVETRACRRILADLLRPIADLDVAQVSQRIIAHFGSLPAALTATRREQLRAADGDERVVQQLRAVRQASLRSRRLALDHRPVIGNERAVLEYLMVIQGSEIVETVRVLYLDARNHLIRDELATRGTVDEAPVYVREIIGRALELGATGIILAHNHPSGDPEPSLTDEDMTASLAAAAKTMGIMLHDHVIVARASHFSFRSAGLLC